MSDAEHDIPGRKWFPTYDTRDGVTAATQLLQERRDRLSRCLELARTEPVGKRIRKLRVATRRVDMAARFAAPLVSGNAVKRARRALRSLRRAGGAVRRCDVFITRLQETAAAADGHDVARASIALIGRLGAQRASALRAFVDTLSENPVQGPLDRIAIRDASNTGAELLGMTLLRDAGAAFATLAAVPTLEIQALHDLRLRAKKLRYAAEVTAPIVGERAAGGLINAVTPLQDELGTVNDLAELADELAAFHTDVADLPGAESIRSGVDRLLLAASAERDRRAVAFAKHRRDLIGAVAEALAELRPRPGLRLADDEPRSETA